MDESNAISTNADDGGLSMWIFDDQTNSLLVLSLFFARSSISESDGRSSPDVYRTVDPRDPDAGVTPTVPGIPTSIVNGTAPQPSVILRIVNSEGEDITGTKLGEPLFIRYAI